MSYEIKKRNMDFRIKEVWFFSESVIFQLLIKEKEVMTNGFFK